MLTGLVLGPGRGFAAVGLYMLLGLAGLPIFSGGPQRPGHPRRPLRRLHHRFPAGRHRGGLADRRRDPAHRHRTGKLRAVLLFAAAMASSIVFIHGLGILGMMVNAKLDFSKAFLADLVFYPGDIIKNVLAVSYRRGPAPGLPGSAAPPRPDG